MSHLLKIGATCALGAPSNSPFPIFTDNYCTTADWLAEHGFDSMEVHIRDPKDLNGPQLFDHCQKIGLSISSIGTGMAYGMEGLSITSPDSTVRRRAIQRLKEQLDLGAQLKCPIVIGSLRGIIGPEQSFAQVDARMVESMLELADYAETVNGEIVVEAIDRFETDYLRTAADVLGLIDRVGSNRVLVHLDTFHMNLEEQNWRSAILSCRGKLGHVHVADNSRNYPGWGLIDFRTIISLLLEIGYDRSLTIECYPFPDGPTAALRGLQHLSAIMDAYGGR